MALAERGSRIIAGGTDPYPTIDTHNSATLLVPLKAVLRPGAYTVQWRAETAEGPKTSGSYNWTVGPTNPKRQARPEFVQEGTSHDTPPSFR